MVRSFVLLVLLVAVCFGQQFVKDEYMNHDTQRHENITKGIDNNEILNIFIVAHTHDDPGWLVTTDQYYFKQVRFILSTIIPVLKLNKDRKFTYVEQAYFQRWWNEQNNQTRYEIRELVQNGQLEMNLGGWVMADEAGTHYEDIINEMTLGHKYIFDQFGVRPKVGWHIDPFGHSNQVSTLYSQMGFDAFSIYRIHHDDVDKRMADKNLEFVWRGSKSLDKESDIFLNYLDTGYKAPDECELFSQYGGGVQYTVDDDRWVQWDEDLPTYKTNIKSKADKCVEACKKRAVWHDNGNNLLIVWGADFTFQNAFVPFENMDKLIEYVNAHESEYHVHMQYAVLSDYIKAVHEHDKKWDIKRDDFFPYAREESAYWTGYYTSRDRLKGLVREKMNELSNAEMYLALSKATKKNLKFDELYKDILKLRKAQGEVQHHDAITGTEKQAVANDYNVQLVDGAFFTNKAVSEMLNVYTTLDNLNKNATEVFSQLTKENAVVLLLSNPVGWSRKETIQVLLPRSDISVYDKNDNEIESQIIEVPEFSYDHRNGTHYLYFVHEIPAMGYSSVYLKINENREVSKVVNSNFIENDRVKLTLENGYVAYATLSDGSFYRLDANLYHYKSAKDYPKSSGAYAFVPALSNSVSIGKATNNYKDDKVSVNLSSEIKNPAFIYTSAGDGTFTDTFIPVLKSQSTSEIKYFIQRIDKEDATNWNQNLGGHYGLVDLDTTQENVEKGIIDIGSSEKESKYITIQFKTPFATGSTVRLFTTILASSNVPLTSSVISVNETSATLVISNWKKEKWSDGHKLIYIAFIDSINPFTEDQTNFVVGTAEGTTDEKGFVRVHVDIEKSFQGGIVLIQALGDDALAVTSSTIKTNSFEVNCISYLEKKQKIIKFQYIMFPCEAIGEYVVPQNKPISTTVIKGNLVEEIQQTYRTGYHTIFRLYKQGIQSNVIELNTELNNVDEGRELVLQFHTSLKNDKTVYADTIGMEQQKRVFNPDFTQPIAGNFYPVVSRAYIEDESKDMRLSVLVDRAHGVSSLRDRYMEIMLKRRTIGDDGFGVGEPLTENDQVKEKMWLILGNREESSIYKKYDILMNHYPVQFYGIENEKKEINDVYSSLLSELPPQIQLLNFQLLTPEDKTFLLRLHHIYEKDESKENSIEVEVDLNKIFREFEIVDYEEMILTGMFKKSEVEEERMKWKTVEDDNVMESNETVNVLNRNIRGSKSFIIRMKPMEFKTFQVTIN